VPQAVDSENESSLSLDSDIPALDDTLGDEFSDGLDFGDALDLADGGDDISLDLSAGDEPSELTDENGAMNFDLGASLSAETDENELLVTDDIPSLDEEASLEDVPTLDLDDNESLEFDLSSESEELNLDESGEVTGDADMSDAVVADDNALDFDLDALDTSDDVAETPLSEPEDIAGNELEFDLGSLAGAEDEAGVDDLLADLGASEEDSDSLDLEFDAGENIADVLDEVTELTSEEELPPEEELNEEEADLLDLSAEIADFATDDSAELSDLESLMDAEGSIGDTELPDLSFDMEEETGFAESGEDDLKELEAELDSVVDEDEDVVASEPEISADEVESSVAEETPETELDLDSDINTGEELPDLTSLEDDDEEMDFASDLADLDAELEDFEAPVISADENPVEEVDVPVIEDDIPVVDEPQAEPSEEQDIDLDKLAAAEDEFDFLAGTDECATKLDLARAYIDMEDMDGARELLQEVLQEGSDQQKQDARGLMDNLS